MIFLIFLIFLIFMNSVLDTTFTDVGSTEYSVPYGTVYFASSYLRPYPRHSFATRSDAATQRCSDGR